MDQLTDIRLSRTFATLLLGRGRGFCAPAMFYLFLDCGRMSNERAEYEKLDVEALQYPNEDGNLNC